jgi:hypothetical protein
MARVIIAGRGFDLAPYKLAQLKAAAPFIDRINATQGALTSVEGMAASASDFLGVLAVGLMRIDPSLTLEALEEMVGLADIPSLRDGFMAVLVESGMIAGEIEAPAPAEPMGALPTASALSSAN